MRIRATKRRALTAPVAAITPRVTRLSARPTHCVGEGVAMTTMTSESVSTDSAQAERRPLMSGSALLMMNLGFFGVQFSFGLTQSAVNPLFLLIGASPDQLPILNLAGPITGLLIQPLIGAIVTALGTPAGVAIVHSSPQGRSSARSRLPLANLHCPGGNEVRVFRRRSHRNTDQPRTKPLTHIRIIGLMGMASNTDDGNGQMEFHGLKNLFESFKKHENERIQMQELSMGMSGDYVIAMEEGSTLVRVGSAIFGSR